MQAISSLIVLLGVVEDIRQRKRTYQSVEKIHASLEDNSFIRREFVLRFWFIYFPISNEGPSILFFVNLLSIISKARVTVCLIVKRSI